MNTPLNPTLRICVLVPVATSQYNERILKAVAPVVPPDVHVEIRNITQGTDLGSGVLHTQAPTTTSYPTHFLHTPPIKYTGGVAADHLQIFIIIDVINSAGTLTVDAGSLEAIPLRLT